MQKDFKNYYKAVRYIESLSRVSKPEFVKGRANRNNKLKRFSLFMEKLGNPQLGQKYIHISGTSGKGSVASMLQSVLVEAGYKTGLFLSPHTTSKIDRIRINNLFISPKEFAKITEEVKPAIKEMQKTKFGHPAHFEICLAIAFIYFKKNQCDYVVLEVGVGGQNDATNIIPFPAAAIINSVGLDHEKLLGHSLAAIARKKAGIIKKGCAFFTTTNNQKNVLEIFKTECKEKRVPYHCIKIKDNYHLRLLGDHQQANANLVAAVSKHLKISQTVIKRGLKKTKLPCRFEIIQKNPLVIIDGAHNESKLLSTLNNLKNLTYQRLFIIIALTQQKKAQTLFKKIAGKADFIFITKHNNYYHRCSSPGEIKDKILKYNGRKEIITFARPQKALEKALNLAGKKDAILITGSLYLAGELRKYWMPEEEILRKRKA